MFHVQHNNQHIEMQEKSFALLMKMCYLQLKYTSYEDDEGSSLQSSESTPFVPTNVTSTCSFSITDAKMVSKKAIVNPQPWSLATPFEIKLTITGSVDLQNFNFPNMLNFKISIITITVRYKRFYLCRM